jgi:hypothetical protein
MRYWYETYAVAWVAFYAMSVSAACILMGASLVLARQRWARLWATLFALLTIGAGPFVISIPLVATSWLAGALLRSRRRLFPTVAILGLIGVTLDSFWLSKMPVASNLTTNRPTLLRLAIGLARSDEVFRGGTMYSGSEPVVEQEAALFGRYPIRVGMLDHMDNPRFEFQVLTTLVVFVALFLLCRMSTIRRHLGRHPPIEIAAAATFIFLLPIHGLIPLTILLGTSIGRVVNGAGILSTLLKRRSEVQLVVWTLLLLVLYHASFASTLLDGFGPTDTNWGAFYASAGMIAVIFGAISGHSGDRASGQSA